MKVIVATLDATWYWKCLVVEVVTFEEKEKKWELLLSTKTQTTMVVVIKTYSPCFYFIDNKNKTAKV